MGESIAHKPNIETDIIPIDDGIYASLNANDEHSECQLDGSVNPFSQSSYSAWSSHNNVSSGSPVQLSNVNQQGCPQTYNNQACIQGLENDNGPIAYDNNGSFHTL